MTMDIDYKNLRSVAYPESDPAFSGRTDGPAAFFQNFKETLGNVKALSRSLRIFLFDMALVEGTEKHSGQAIKTLYIGETQPFSIEIGKIYTKFEAMIKLSNFQFLMDRIYSDYTITMQVKNISGLNMNRMLREYENQADMVFIDAEFLSALRLKRSQFIAIPQWVSFKLRLSDHWEDVLGSFSRKLAKEIRRILKHGYQFYAARTIDQFNSFYHEMYVPYTKARFGRAAKILPRGELEKSFRNGELLFLVRNNQVILGSLSHYKRDRMLIVCAAAADNLQPGGFGGAAEAMDYFSIMSAFEKGYRTVDFLASRPFMNDGGFRYKRKWGTFIDKYNRPLPDIYFKPLCLSEGVKSYLSANPFIIKTRKGFRARLLLRETACEQEIRDCLKLYRIKGVSGIDIFCAAGIQNDALKLSHSADSFDIKIYDTSKSARPEQVLCRQQLRTFGLSGSGKQIP